MDERSAIYNVDDYFEFTIDNEIFEMGNDDYLYNYLYYTNITYGNGTSINPIDEDWPIGNLLRDVEIKRNGDLIGYSIIDGSAEGGNSYTFDAIISRRTGLMHKMEVIVKSANDSIIYQRLFQLRGEHRIYRYRTNQTRRHTVY